MRHARRSQVAAGAILWAGVGFALCGCRADGRSGRVPYELESWHFGPYPGTRLVTAHYEVYTTVDDPRLIETFPQLIERAYEQYQRFVPSGHEPRERLRVYLLANRAQWAYFTRRFTGSRSEVFLKIRNGGYSYRGVSVIQFVANSITFPLLAHEGFHQYLYHCVRRDVPAWVNEGLAVAAEGQRWTGRGLKEFDPWYNPTRRNRLAEALARGRLYSLSELLDTHAGEVIHETSVKVGTYYAQVWGLVLFLWEGQDGKYRDGFRRLCAALRAPDFDQRLRAEQVFSETGRLSRGEALFRSFITDDLETFEREYVAFLRKRFLNEH